jgi:hypothetical protein
MNYPSKELTKNLKPVPRTQDEAFNTAEYASAITIFASELKLLGGFFIEAAIGFLVTLAVIAPFWIGFWLWVNR